MIFRVCLVFIVLLIVWEFSHNKIRKNEIFEKSNPFIEKTYAYVPKV